MQAGVVPPQAREVDHAREQIVGYGRVDEDSWASAYDDEWNSARTKLLDLVSALEV